MRYHHRTFVVFESQKFLQSATPIKDIISYFEKRGVHPEENSTDNKLFPTIYKGDSYLLSLESNEYFNSYFKIESSCDTYAKPKYSDFLTLVQDILFQKFDVKFYDIEFFSEKDFNSIILNFNKRFLSLKSMCLFWENKQIPEVKVEFTEDLYAQDYVSLFKTRLKISEVISDEHTWYAISTALEDDGYEMTHRPFIPITETDYYNEIFGYCHHYQINLKEFYLYTGEKIQSILRVGDTLHTKEYLLKYESEYFYILLQYNVP